MGASIGMDAKKSSLMIILILGLITGLNCKLTIGPKWKFYLRFNNCLKLKISGANGLPRRYIQTPKQLLILNYTDVSI